MRVREDKEVHLAKSNLISNAFHSPWDNEILSIEYNSHIQRQNIDI